MTARRALATASWPDHRAPRPTHKQLLIDADRAIARLIITVQKKGDWLGALDNARHVQSQLRAELSDEYGVRAFGIMGPII